MIEMTRLIEEEVTKHNSFKEIYQETKKLFKHKEYMHIEHILSHIGDLISLIERTENKEIKINDFSFSQSGLLNLYDFIIGEITNLVRYGYVGENDDRGRIDNPLVEINEHREFIKALFFRLENLDRRANVNFFTTNYDTLLEDALNLENKKVRDGFIGGAMGFWEPKLFKEKYIDEYLVCKLHGSIDWYNSKKDGLVRARYGTTYMNERENTMIYPQATKYVETQKDPFAYLFDMFRNTLNSSESILGVCGYSFGDNHINIELENALKYSNTQLTLLVFIKELNEEVVKEWLEDSDINNRIYVMTENGIYHRNSFYKSPEDRVLTWWAFGGLTDLLQKGEEY